MPDAVRTIRHPDAPIEELLLGRWSPRAMSGEPIADAELARLFEAARWAPSSGNSQPWRYVYGRRGTPAFDVLFGLLTEGNRRWAGQGALLAVVLAVDVDPRNGKVLRTNAYDAGAAWENLALQGCAMGLVVHGMQGFDYDRARSELQVPDGVSVLAMFAIGRPGASAALPEDLQKREVPSQRNPVATFAFEGIYPAAAPSATT